MCDAGFNNCFSKMLSGGPAARIRSSVLRFRGLALELEFHEQCASFGVRAVGGMSLPAVLGRSGRDSESYLALTGYFSTFFYSSDPLEEAGLRAGGPISGAL